MIAPKGPGHTVRSEYVKGGGVPSLVSVFQNKSGNAFDVALAYGSGLGAGRSWLSTVDRVPSRVPWGCRLFASGT